MRNDRDPLNLQSLPAVSPPRDAWQEIQSRLPAAPEKRGRHPGYWLAVAAVLALGTGLTVLLTTPGQTDAPAPELDRWVDYSMDLEQQLRDVEDTRTRYRGHEALAVAQLQRMLAAVDAEIESTPQGGQLALWKQRAVVLNDLLAIQGTQGWVAADTPRPVVTRSSPSTLVAYEI